LGARLLDLRLKALAFCTDKGYFDTIIPTSDLIEAGLVSEDGTTSYITNLQVASSRFTPVRKILLAPLISS
jgi:hypothetical protein